MRLIPAIIIAMAVIAAPLVWLLIVTLMGPGDGTVGFDGPAIDSGARIELEALRQQSEVLQAKVEELEGRISRLEAGGFSAGPAPQPGQIPREGPNQIIDAYAQVVLIANRRNVNKGLTVASPSYLISVLGEPRETLSDDCEPMTNPKLTDMLVIEDVGPIRVQMLQPAVDSLKRVFAKVEATDPDLYARINTAGSLCVRQIRGTVGRASTHSFGLSLDLNIDGSLDTLGDGKTQLGLTILADFFKEEGWFWGAAFSREDSMHFEVSREMVERWREEGKI